MRKTMTTNPLQETRYIQHTFEMEPSNLELLLKVSEINDVSPSLIINTLVSEYLRLLSTLELMD